VRSIRLDRETPSVLAIALIGKRRGIAFRQRVIEIARRIVPETIREPVRERINELIEGLRPPDTSVPGHEIGMHKGRGPEQAAATGQVPEMPAPVAADLQTQSDGAEDVEEALRRARTKALIRHARAIDAILTTGDADGRGSPEQMRELNDARKAFEDVRPHGWRDAETGYVKNPEFVSEAARGNVNRAVRALQLETEIRTGPQRRADLFVERWQKLHQSSQRQYQDGDISAYKATRSEMADMAKGLERDPQMESLLANRKAALGIEIESGRRLGVELAFNHGIGLGRGRVIEM